MVLIPMKDFRPSNGSQPVSDVALKPVEGSLPAHSGLGRTLANSDFPITHPWGVILPRVWQQAPSTLLPF